MATFRKRNGKWQVIVRHKSIGTVSRSFIAKTQAVKWALEQEERIEEVSLAALSRLRLLSVSYFRDTAKKLRRLNGAQRLKCIVLED